MHECSVMEHFFPSAFERFATLALEVWEKQHPTDDCGQTVAAKLGIEQGSCGSQVHGENQYGHHSYLGEYLYEKQPVVDANFLFPEEMVEVEFVQTIDEGHHQDECCIALGNDGVEETWEEM